MGKLRMKLTRTKEEVEERTRRYAGGYKLSNASMIIAMFTTTEDAIREIVPPPLEPGPILMASAYVAEFRESNFCPPYNEAAVFLPVQYKGEAGSYCVSMPVDNDLAMIGGREIYGYPKKIAESISVERTGDTAKGICIRRGIPIIEIEVTLTDVMEERSPQGPHFLVKSILDERGLGVGMKPLLVRQQNRTELQKLEIGEGTVTFHESQYDPLHQIPIVDVMMVSYTEGATITMPFGEIVAELDSDDYGLYHFIKYDWNP
ncbi:MAG: acetoacetate decarboxylase family protein [Candidatus Hodarchaeota archaeon]